MIYEVTARFYFDEEDEAVDFFHDCELTLPKATIINPGQENEQPSYADLIICRHDTHPPEPCDLNQHIDNSPPT